MGHNKYRHKICSLVVKKDLKVCQDADVNRNLTVCGNQLVKGDQLVEGTQVASTSVVGEQTVEGNQNVLFDLNVGQDLTVGGRIFSNKQWLLAETRFSTEIVNNAPARTLLCWGQPSGPLSGFDRSDGSFTAGETGLYEITFNTRSFALTFDLTNGEFVPNQPNQQVPGNRYAVLIYEGQLDTKELGNWTNVALIPDDRYDQEKNGIVFLSVTAQIPMYPGDKVTPRYFAEYDVVPPVPSPPPELRVTPYTVGLMSVCQVSAQELDQSNTFVGDEDFVASNGEGPANPLV